MTFPACFFKFKMLEYHNTKASTKNNAKTQLHFSFRRYMVATSHATSRKYSAIVEHLI